MAFTTTLDSGTTRPVCGWMRRRYFVDDGHIKPAVPSTVQPYDPLGAVVTVRNQRRHLFEELASLDASDVSAIESFTTHWGLLGLFQTHVHRVLFPAERTDQTWKHEGLQPYYEVSDWGNFRKLTMRVWPKHSPLKFAVVVPDPEFYPQRQDNVLPYLERYFPRLASSWSADPSAVNKELFSVLQSAAFWDHLSEPVSLFQSAVRGYQDTYRLCKEWTGGCRDQYHAREISEQLNVFIKRVHAISRYLPSDSNGLAASETVNPKAAEPSGTLSLGWSFPSLLSAACIQLTQQLNGGRYLRTCANETCRREFISDLRTKQFCDAACQNAQKQRRFRREQEKKRQQSRP